jgi:hypothetical protein
MKAKKMVILNSIQNNKPASAKPSPERVSSSHAGQKIASMTYFGQEKNLKLAQNNSIRLKKPENISFKGFFFFLNPYDLTPEVSKFIKQFDGAQKGIKTLDGLDIVQTFIATSNPLSFPPMRGCRNACSHCYADAKPPIRNTATHISSILWEDFTSLLCGISEFKSRIDKPMPIDIPQSEIFLPFWDSDSIPVKMPDLKGGFHGITEAVELLYTKLHKPVLIDTAGWSMQDKWSQTQAQELARYAKDNPDAVHSFNISLNLFGPLMEKSFALKDKRDLAGADKMEQKYIDRMANVFLTFWECKRVYPFTKLHNGGHYVPQKQFELNNKIADRIIGRKRG